MKSFLTAFTLVACIVLSTGCGGKKSLVVLMPDPEGTVGRVTVSNPQGRQVLTEAYAATEIKENRAPGAVRRMRENEVKAVFSDALQAEPDAPASFTLYFITGTATLTESSLRHLKAVQAEIRRRLPCEVYIAGHTDTVGKKEDNAALSFERARIVRDELVKIGVDPALIQVSAHGENDPLVPTADEVDEPRNRRVEIFIR
jgi:outer membrane protein OmpA-like peptidoglycan-associated protein